MNRRHWWPKITERWLIVKGWALFLAVLCITAAVFLPHPYPFTNNGNITRAFFAVAAVVLFLFSRWPEDVRWRVAAVGLTVFVFSWRAFTIALVGYGRGTRVIGAVLWAIAALLTYVIALTSASFPRRGRGERRGHVRGQPGG